MLTKKIVEPAQIELTAVILFAQMKDGTSRFCDDYEKFKAHTNRDS